ncbi:MAG: glutathione S-transferase [Deltaproteobacteria bacterium]|nr:glutathione S-transferase [Deltaproteobacteria bacterium]
MPTSPPLRLAVLSLAYSSWSMRPWLALRHAGASFTTSTAEVELGKRDPRDPADTAAETSGDRLTSRRALGSVTGLFPVLHVGDTAIHESLAICEWVAETFPAAGLWPDDRLARARARAVACEMMSSFTSIRAQLSSHLFGRLPAPLALDDATASEVARVFELWRDALDRSGGPYLFGRFTIADAMYYPMRARFRTYDVALPDDVARYAAALDATPAVRDLVALARTAPHVPAYDAYLRALGGEPDAGRADD